MELQICVLFTTLVVCGADIRPAGWLDKVVAHWKKSFVDDFEQLAPFNLEASIEPVPPGYQDSPDWDFDSVTRMLALLSVSETGQPALNSLRRMIAPTRRMMMAVPGLAQSYIPQSLYNNRNKNRLGMKERRGMRYYRKRTGYNQGTRNRKGMAGNRKGMARYRKGMAGNRMGIANNRMGMAGNRKGMAGNRKGMAGNRKGMAGNRKGMAFGRMGMYNKRGNGRISRKQMIVKKEKERELSDLQKNFRLFPSLKDQIPNNIYYDEELNDYEDASPEFSYVIEPNVLEEPEEAIVLLRNPVEARLPSARISVRLLKEILEARAEAARVMPPLKTTPFTWQPVDLNTTTPLTNDTSAETTTADDAATGDIDNEAATDGGGGEDTTPGGEGGEAATEPGGGAPTDVLPPEGRKMVAKHRTITVAAKRRATTVAAKRRTKIVAAKHH